MSKKFKNLGAKTKYNFNKPNPKLLETFENKHQKNLYLIPFIQERDEFTSLCPVTGQPDHARMEIIYVPDKLCIESKALKLYLMSFRNSGEFHEDICNRIADDLCALLDPYYLRVYGNFASRGSLSIKPLVERWNLDDKQSEKWFMHVINSWDIKK